MDILEEEYRAMDELRTLRRKTMKWIIGILAFIATITIIGTIIIDVSRGTEQEDFEEWLVIDQTDQHEYVYGSYMCIQFADQLIKNATAAGFDVCMAGVDYTDSDLGHGFVCVLLDGERTFCGTVFHELGFYDAVDDENLGGWVRGSNIKRIYILSDYTFSNVTSIRAVGAWTSKKPGENWVIHDC